ncbi:MAG TPA: ABC transporter substrate-binding protein [Acidimicrobiia bacterium]
MTGLVALGLSGSLLLAACGGGNDKTHAALPAPADHGGSPAAASVDPAPAAGAAPAPDAGASAASAGAAAVGAPAGAVPAAGGPAGTTPTGPKSAAGDKPAPVAANAQSPAPGAKAGTPGPGGTAAPAPGAPAPNAGAPAPVPGGPGGASDTGITGNEILLGSISSVSSPMSKYVVSPVTKAAQATISSINDNGGVLGRKLRLIDCDDAGDIARFRACYGKLVHEQKVFSLVTSMTFGSGEVHGDLARDRIPWVGDIGWYGSSWTDPWMIPMYFSAVADGSAIAQWVSAVIKPQRVGILYLNTPEMKAAKDEITRVLKTKNINVVKAISQELDTADESPAVLQFRSANVDHIIHVSWPPPVVKFMIDAAQQGFYPEKGMSGNHFVAEAVPELIGKWPLNRYWNSSAYQVWGPEYEAIMKKYAPGLSTLHHHNTQTAYIAMRLFKEAAEEVGPNLTRDALMKAFESHPWDAGPGLAQTFLWKPGLHDTLRCNYMFKYTSMEEGSGKVWTPDPTQFKSCGDLPQQPLSAAR